jgi:ribosomal silencing factor RsfS
MIRFWFVTNGQEIIVHVIMERVETLWCINYLYLNQEGLQEEEKILFIYRE